MRCYRQHNQGFTLIELLVVMVVSMVLMGLILGPVIQSFKLTRRAQAMVDAQDGARLAMQMMSRELGQAMYVYDNAQAPVTLVPDGTTDTSIYPDAHTPIMLPVRQPNGDVQGFVLPYAKIDFVLPKITMHCNNPDHGPESRDYPRGDQAWPPCPICGSEEVDARPKLPLAQDVTVVRYFLGLRYNNPDPAAGDPPFGWESPWKSTSVVGEGNQVVLYRAEFSPYDDKLFPKDMSVFKRLSDPIFFYRNALNPDNDPFCDRWMHISRAIGIAKYEDLVTVTTDDASVVTAIDPTITFRTAAVDNDTFAGTYASDKTFEYPDAVPTTFRGTHGYWTPDFRVICYRNDYNIAYSTDIDPSSGDLVVSRREFSAAAGTWTVATSQFNITKYDTEGIIENPSGGPVEMAFTIDNNRGTVNFALNPPTLDGSGAGPVCELIPADINQTYRDNYNAYRVAIRSEVLSTFVDTSAQYLEHARIVPGSEQIVGPDMTPGYEHSGKLVRYQRVPLALGDPGLNQYKLDYDNGVIYFSSVWDQDLPDTNEFGEPLGVPIQAYYKVQFNQNGDVVRGDYSTRSLVNIHLQMRMYDPESGNPHPVDLNDSIKVRNALR